MDHSLIRRAWSVLNNRPLKFGDEQIRALHLLERVEALRSLLWRAGLKPETINSIIAAADDKELARLEFAFHDKEAA